MEKGRMLLRMFKGKIETKYNLPGEVFVYRNNERLTNDYAYLGDIVKPNTKLIFIYDSTVAVGKGGFGEGGQAEGNLAIADGGLGMGGVFGEKGPQGGDGAGGDAWGDKAKGGMGQGGIANDAKGVPIEAAAGDGLGGKAREAKPNQPDVKLPSVISGHNPKGK
jgi:hypothetical protein